MSTTTPSLIQEGSHGCVFNPPLPCRDSKAVSKVNVGKVMKIRNSEIELNIANILHSIPGWKRYYTLQRKDSCSPTDFSKLRAEIQTDCSIYKQESDNDLIQLLSPYSGIRLETMAISTTFDFLETFRHVLEGLVNLEKQGICHYDLHEGNVLVDHHGTFRLIDFGSAFIGDSISENAVKKHIYNFSPEYPPQPPELSVQNGLYQGLEMKYIIKEVVKQKKVFYDARVILALPLTQSEEEMVEFWKDDTTWVGEGWEKFFRTYWRTWDSWAIGVIFTSILKKCLLLNNFQPVWKKHGHTIRKVLRGCLHSNPMKRWTAIQALSAINLTFV